MRLRSLTRIAPGAIALVLLTGFVARSAIHESAVADVELAPQATLRVPEIGQPEHRRVRVYVHHRVVLAVPAALTDPGLGLRAPPVAVPVELRMPSLGVAAVVLGVGVTPKNVMDAPMGSPNDPVWQQAFWYRGSAIPGARSTALIAGHIDDPLGRPGVFGHIDGLRPGDPIVVHDIRTGLDVRFKVTHSTTFALDATTDAAVLTEIYGVGPVAGTVPQASADGLSHLTLITCAGTFRNGTHDHRLAVFATRVG